MEEDYQADRPTGRTVQLFVRASTVREVEERINDVVDELRTLETAGAIDEFTVRTWHRRVPVTLQFDETVSGTDVLATYDEFSSWATNTKRSLSPFFEYRSGPGSDCIVFPIMCLSIFDHDGSIEAVYPHTNGEVTYSVADGLRTLDTRATHVSDNHDSLEKTDLTPTG